MGWLGGEKVAVRYDSIVPWGRTFEEYVDMFDLEERDLEKSILGCGDGPACFNAAMHQKGKKAVSIDPIYKFTDEEIQRRIDETYLKVMQQTRENQEKFVWHNIKSVEELGEIRMSAMKAFLMDYNAGKKEERYLFAELPSLPFQDKQFDLALSSHFLFLYTDHLSLGFHIQSIDEMLRVADEIRIFPLVDMNANRSCYVDSVITRYRSLGFSAHEIQVDYEFQKGGNKMLRIYKNDNK